MVCNLYKNHFLRLVVYSFQNIIQHDMPKISVFDLFRETDVEFLARTNWQYLPQAPVYVPNPTIVIQSPVGGAAQ